MKVYPAHVLHREARMYRARTASIHHITAIQKFLKTIEWR